MDDKLSWLRGWASPLHPPQFLLSELIYSITSVICHGWLGPICPD